MHTQHSFASAACSCGVRLQAGWLAGWLLAFADAHFLWETNAFEGGSCEGLRLACDHRETDDAILLPRSGNVRFSQTSFYFPQEFGSVLFCFFVLFLLVWFFFFGVSFIFVCFVIWWWAPWMWRKCSVSLLCWFIFSRPWLLFLRK